MEVTRIDVVIRSDPDDASTEEVVTVNREDRTVEITRFVSGVITVVARLPVPVGFVSQIRLVVPARRSIVASFPDGDEGVVLPSGDHTGLKVTAPEGTFFEVRLGEFTGVKALFDPADRMVENRGQGLMLKPTLPAVEIDPAELLGAVPDQLLVAFEPGTRRSRMERIHEDAGAVILKELRSDFHLVRLSSETLLFDAISFYLSKIRVEFASPNWILHTAVTPIDLRPDQLLDLVNAEAAWDITRGDRSIVVAVLDTGANLRHRDLAPKLWINEDELPAACLDDNFPPGGDGCKDCDIDCRFEAEGRVLNGEPIVGDGIITMRDFNLWHEEYEDSLNRVILRELARVLLDGAGIRDCWPVFPPRLPSPPLYPFFPAAWGLIDGLDLLNPDPSRTNCGVRDGIDNLGGAFPDAIVGWNFQPELTISLEDSTGASELAGFGPADEAVPWDDNNCGARDSVGIRRCRRNDFGELVEPDGMHGTAMEGIIGAATDNFDYYPSTGSTSPVALAGMAWEVRLMIVKVCDENGACSLDRVLEGAEFAVEHGANIVSMSIGHQAALAEVIPDEEDANYTADCAQVLPWGDQEWLQKWAAEYALSWHKMLLDVRDDVAFFAAALNCPIQIGTIRVTGDRPRDVEVAGSSLSFPGSLVADNLMTVAGAVDGSVVAGRSAFGPAVHIAAPTGVRALSYGEDRMIPMLVPAHNNFLAGGSSPATAYVAGTAVLVQAACPDLELTAPEIIGLIEAGARTGVVPDEKVPGGLFLDARGAVEAACALPGCGGASCP